MTSLQGWIIALAACVTAVAACVTAVAALRVQRKSPMDFVPPLPPEERVDYSAFPEDDPAVVKKPSDALQEQLRFPQNQAGEGFTQMLRRLHEEGGAVTGEFGARNAVVADPIHNAPPPACCGQTITTDFGDRFLLEELLHQRERSMIVRATDIHDRPAIAKIFWRNARYGGCATEHYNRERASTATLSHRNIVRLLGFGKWDGQPFLISEYMAGGSLHGLVKRGGYSGKELLSMAKQIADGVDAIHARNWVHRDIKPENIYLEAGASGRVAVGDFGTALHLEDLDNAGPPERTRVIECTPAYAAPEVLQFEPATPAADVYAFGVTLFELIAGEPPFSGVDLLDLLRRKREGVPRLSDFRSVPAELDDRLAEALYPDPDLRPATAGAMLNGIEPLLAALRPGSLLN